MISVLFISLAICLMMGIPVAFSIGISTMLFLFSGGDIGMVIMTQKVIDGINSFPLMALPLFVLSGGLMGFGSTPRIMNLANMFLGKKRWGLGSAGIVGCAVFGTISGSGVATASAIGGVIAPEMVRHGYPKGFTASLIAGAGTMGAVIPPSISFVVYSQVTGTSIADMFAAGIIPGCLCCFLLTILNRYLVIRKDICKDLVPHKYTAEERKAIYRDAVLPLLTPVIILGGVFSGLLTPTEAAAAAVIYATILSVFVYKELDSVHKFVKVCGESAVTSAVILLIMGFAGAFAWGLTTQNIANIFAEWVLSISSQKMIVYTTILVILLIMGTFMECLAIILLTTPIFLPILVSLGVDPISYGVVLNMSTCVGAVSPPLAVTLFTACRVVKISVEETFPYVLYVLGVMTIATALVMIWPQLATFLPSVLL